MSHSVLCYVYKTSKFARARQRASSGPSTEDFYFEFRCFQMERARRVKFETNLSFSRHQTQPYFMDEKIDERGAVELFKEKSQLSARCYPLEVPKCPNEAMEFLSRTWSPSSSDFFQILSFNGREHEQELQEQQTEESGIVHLDKDEQIRLEQALTLFSTGNLVQSAAGKHKQLHTSWNVGQIKAWLGGELFSSLSKRCRTRRKEKLRLHVAQVHAALSVTRLAAGIAGIMANSRMETINPKAMGTGDSVGELDQKLASVVASSAALIATVCAEAAESVGAGRDCVASAISTGLLTKSSADLVALTATAATCLRGAATLELRAPSSRHTSEDQKTLARGALLPVRMPEGKVRIRSVYIFLRHDKLTVRIAERYLHGLISRSKEYRIFQAVEDLRGGGISEDAHGCCSITLGTTGGAMQVLFEDQTLCRIWSSTLFRLLRDS